MNAQELTKETALLKETIKNLIKRYEELETQIKQHDKLFEELVRITNKSEKEIDMLKRWRG